MKIVTTCVFVNYIFLNTPALWIQIYRWTRGVH